MAKTMEDTEVDSTGNDWLNDLAAKCDGEYRAVVNKIAGGETVPETKLRPVLHAAGKSVADLTADVQKRRDRLAAFRQLDQADKLQATIPELNKARGLAVGKLNALKKRHAEELAAAVREVQIADSDLAETQRTAGELQTRAERTLRDTAPVELIARLKAIQNAITENQNNAVRAALDSEVAECAQQLATLQAEQNQLEATLRDVNK